MAEFSPSQHSARNNCGGRDYSSVADLIGPAISAAGSITGTVIGSSSSRKVREAQLKNEQELADKQAELTELQAQAERAKGSSASAGSALEALKTKRTMVLVGFGVISVGLLGLITTSLFQRSPEAEYEDEE